MRIPMRLRLVLAVCVFGLFLGSFSASASAAEPGTGWDLTATSYPTNLPPGGRGVIAISVYNVGAQASNGTVTVTDTLPLGLIATAAGRLKELRVERIGWDCTGIGTRIVTCTNNEPGGEPISMPGGGAGPGSASNSPFSDENLIGIAVAVAPSAAGGASNRVVVAGGGAVNAASTEALIAYSSAPPGFGFANWDVWFSNADGTLDTQAGSHPYSATFAFTVNNAVTEEEGKRALGLPGGELRNIAVNLPPGLVGNPNATPRCTREELDNNACPPDTQIGIQAVALNIYGGSFLKFPIYNMVPPRGVAAQFASIIQKIITTYDSGVRSGAGGEYGIVTHVDNTPQKAIVSSITTLWGTPGDPSHASERTCEAEVCPYGGVPQPLFTMPTSCAGPQEFSIRSNTWQNPGVTGEAHSLYHDSNGVPVGFTGCEHLSFDPSVSLAPDTAAADTPAGLTAVVEPTLGGLEVPSGMSTADIKNTVVTLPEGVAINPGQAAGLQACPLADDGLAPLPDGEEDDGPPSCPAASKVGTVKIKTPLLEGSFESELEGNVYILPSNPPNLQILVAASGDGVNLKLIGDVHLNEQTGQLTTTFAETPGLPFNDFKLSFSGGAQAALTTPVSCGVYTSAADFSPWSGLADVFTGNSFAIQTGPLGTSCPSSPLPFTPSLTAGSTTDQAGGFTSFSLLLQSGDAQKRIEKLQFKFPPGFTGLLADIPLCSEPQAAQGTCSSASQIGHATVASGPGPYPLVIPQPGEPESPMYLTGPYEGAPFGLTIVTHVIAGPFNLGTIITRARIEIDPHTAQITITTDPLPQVVAGVPTDLRLINAVADREGFMLNPTNCNPSSFSGTAWGTPPPGVVEPGATAPISSHYQVGSCQSLKFAPKFSVSTSGKTSKANGAGLTAKLSYPHAAQGTQANITKVKVDLPKQLPSRLTTLQKACTNAQFEANPANCPAASKIGYAVVHTPLLPVPLEGPAIFVSHGGEAFPSLTMVLQGDNVTIDLVGTTFISKAGITSTTFKTVPDEPFSTFELNLPQGKFSALAANGNLCTSKLVMPTEFVAQNGLVIHQSTPIGVTGCAKKKSLTRAQKLAAALKACHKKKAKTKRAACERRARKQYGPPKTKTKKKKR
jgi:hypothetical protein